ncbi:MAG: hypothetical protein R2713_16275 [Ilumatobacteraceae bacterium]
MLALIPVRDATLPAGALEAAAECGDRSLLIGERVGEALGHLVGEVHCCEAGRFRPGAWAEVLAHALADEPVVVLPASPDGRDLGPRLAAALDRPFFAGAVQVSTTTVVVPRDGGRSMHTMAAPASFVATLQVGVRGVEPSDAVPTVTPAAFSVTDADVEPAAPAQGVPTPGWWPCSRPTPPPSTSPKPDASSAAAPVCTTPHSSTNSPPSAHGWARVWARRA